VTLADVDKDSATVTSYCYSSVTMYPILRITALCLARVLGTCQRCMSSSTYHALANGAGDISHAWCTYCFLSLSLLFADLPREEEGYQKFLDGIYVSEKGTIAVEE